MKTEHKAEEEEEEEQEEEEETLWAFRGSIQTAETPESVQRNTNTATERRSAYLKERTGVF